MIVVVLETAVVVATKAVVVVVVATQAVVVVVIAVEDEGEGASLNLRTT